MKKKVAKKDFTYLDLPHNRKEVFFDVIKLHWKTLLVLAIFLLLAFLPFLLIAFFRDYYALGLTLMVQEGSMTAANRLATLKIVHLIAALCLWASLYFAALFLGPVFRITRQLIWSEPIFFKEDFIKGLKENYKSGAVVATFSGLAMVIAKLTLFVGDNAVVQAIPMALFLAFIAPPMILAYTMSTIYNGKYFSLLKSAILIFIKEAPKVLLFTLILLSPFALAYIESSLMVKYLVSPLILFFIVPFTILLYSLAAHSIFDKYINQYEYPSLYKKGIYDLSKEGKKTMKETLTAPHFYWSEEKKKNQELIFTLDCVLDQGFLRIFAADTYQVFINGEFVSYGPSRTAAGYAAERRIPLNDVHHIEIRVLSFGADNYEVDRQDPFFSAQVFTPEHELAYDTSEFKCFTDSGRENNNPKYSCQRGFIERYNMDKTYLKEIDKVLVMSPQLLEERKDRASYEAKAFSFVSDGDFTGFGKVHTPWWKDEFDKTYDEHTFSIDHDFLDVIQKGYHEYNYALDRISTGFISLEMEVQENTTVFICFEEMLFNGKMEYARGANNDLIVLHLAAGKNHYLTREPYEMKYVKILSETSMKAELSLILLENKETDFIHYEGDKEVLEVIDAAKATYQQCALDIDMDCPGRERAGWLCDSYFTSQAELFFSGHNEIERDFLMNFALADTPEIPSLMVPMCFPSEHNKGRYIPNWAMFFLLEVCDYYRRTEDAEFVKKIKKKVENIVLFFEEYTNENGLLENLPSWVFVEWSVCNSEDYLKGVNYPSNMLYACALKEIGALYHNDEWTDKGRKMDEEILKESFNGEFFIENSVRVDNQLVLLRDHISETCQYYALFDGLIPNQEFVKKMVREFGPSREEGSYPQVSRSNVFIGNYLRFIYLNRIHENEQLVEESVDYFHKMSSLTGTLWEKDAPTASCCHGFASSIAVFLAKAITGYQGIKNGSIEWDPSHHYEGKYHLTITHDSSD